MFAWHPAEARRTLQGVFRWFAFRLQSLTARYGAQAPATCCGACKPCVTTAATGLVAAAAAGTVESLTARKSREHS